MGMSLHKPQEMAEDSIAWCVGADGSHEETDMSLLTKQQYQQQSYYIEQTSEIHSWLTKL